MSPKWWVLAAVACGTFMATLDASIVNIALPSITKDLQTDLSGTKWVVMSYLLVITCLILPFGRIADLYGRKQVYLTGFLVFTLGSLLCAFAGALTPLTLYRTVQGFGAAMMMSNGPAVITSNFPPRERGKALGVLAMVVSLGLISGPSIGGVLIAHFGWPSIFLVNVPVGLLGIGLFYRYVKTTPRRPHRGHFDWTGTILQLLFLLTLIVIFDPPAISFAKAYSTPMSRLLLSGLALILLVLFIRTELRSPVPLVDLHLFRLRTFWTSLLSGFLVFVSYSSVTVLMPFFLENTLDIPTDRVGLMMTAIPLTIFVVAPLSGRFSDRLGSKGLCLSGTSLLALALLLMADLFGTGLQPEMTHPLIIVYLASTGFALGLFQSPNNNAVMGQVPADKLGVASALLATIRNLGLVIGTGLSTRLYTWRGDVSGDPTAGIHFAFLVAGTVGCLSFAVTLWKKRGAHT